METKREQAARVLAEIMAAHPSGLTKRQALLLGEENGVAQTTLMAAAKEAGVITIRQGPVPGIWRWPVQAAS